ncbi:MULTISPECIES: DNA-binding protein [Pseudomonas]|uniref:DNA-binding protein n=1 Tax=Pseudomonas TaxID=286 RepID=UPI0005FAD136|nr:MULTISPECIES: DNA-binding protein [Pseudomonas]KJZ39929.1 integrase [Pseudomonas fluorescens]
MARGGVNKAIVQKAREALLARGENPSIDAVRVELGNTGSKTTIHRYLRELEVHEPRPESSREQLSNELTALVGRLLERVMEEGGDYVEQAQAQFNHDKATLEAKLEVSQLALATLQREFDIQHVALETESAELQTSRSSLQTELTHNARLSQNCSDLELRVQEKDEYIRSLEEKHVHARDALEHYRNSIKEQREQEQRRHEGQLQQVQVELRQLQQTMSIKQDELTRLNRDNERLLGESRHQAKTNAGQEDAMQRLAGEINGLKTNLAKAEGAKEMLQEQVVLLREEGKRLERELEVANAQVAEAKGQLAESSTEVARLLQNISEASAT